MTVTKADLAELIYQNIGFAKKDAADLVDTFFNLIKEAMIKEEQVKIKGIGTFYTRSKRARKGRNPKTNESLTISARKVVSYKAGTSLKKLLKVNKKNKTAPHDGD
ncbi:MAG: integration host factor subunit alpha [Deltaproteobacteria bacterium]|nr:integration host factor subunit alpha [Deltaproteobacteria bacterium]MCL5792273.1 integration host factor subunit alpha [Deltaproteobacteria bacterium]